MYDAAKIVLIDACPGARLGLTLPMLLAQEAPADVHGVLAEDECADIVRVPAQLHHFVQRAAVPQADHLRRDGGRREGGKRSMAERNGDTCMVMKGNKLAVVSFRYIQLFLLDSNWASLQRVM